MTFDITDERRKRHRRTANEISRHYVCPIEDCPKSYGSEGSLNQHLKIKHLEHYQQLVQQNNANQHMVPNLVNGITDLPGVHSNGNCSNSEGEEEYDEEAEGGSDDGQGKSEAQGSEKGAGSKSGK